MSNAELMEPLPTFPRAPSGTTTSHYPGLCFKAKPGAGFLQSSGGAQMLRSAKTLIKGRQPML